MCVCGGDICWYGLAPGGITGKRDMTHSSLDSFRVTTLWIANERKRLTHRPIFMIDMNSDIGSRTSDVINVHTNKLVMYGARCMLHYRA